MTHAYLSSPVTPADFWLLLRREAAAVKIAEPALSVFVENTILAESCLSTVLGKLLAGKLATADVPFQAIYDVFAQVPDLAESAQADMVSILKNDPAPRDAITPLLFFKGFHALQCYRLAHFLWNNNRRHFALFMQNRISDLFGVDIHPAAKIGQGVMMDHATGIVIGETAVVENDVLFWHGVTLGGTGSAGGDRHPKIRQGVWLGANSTVLGNVEVGQNSKVAADSVVVADVPPNVTVVGVPAKIVA
jgi:serine O-acetyltransferase